MPATLEIVFRGRDEAASAAQSVRREIDGVTQAANQANSASQGFLSGMLQTAGGVVAAGVIERIGSGFADALGSGLQFNSQMEMVTAQLNAFTKDGEASAAILEMIKERAASTPFAFNEMAAAAAGLMPAARMSGQELETLIEKAEILAASNPAEGLEGAAFALREAVSGDFTSIIERFNLPRQYINQLKEEGVPALEIVQQAMLQMGYDTELVTNLAATATGRWSTFTDTLTNLYAIATRPLFDAFSNGLAIVQQHLDKNMPALTAFAEGIAGRLTQAIQFVANSVLPALIRGFQALQPVFSAVGQGIEQVGEAFGLLGQYAQIGLRVLDGVAGDAVAYGRNIAGQLAEGIYAGAAAYVQQAMAYIGNLISYWLKPGSPPKITPELDQWGKEAGNVYLGGFRDADDVSAFQDLGNLIKDSLGSLVDLGQFADVDVIPTLVESQGDLTRAFEEFNTTGKVSEGVWADLRAELGPFGGQVEAVARSYFDLQSATQELEAAQSDLERITADYEGRLQSLQGELDATTRAYDAQLDPLLRQMDALDAQQQIYDDQERIADLQEKIADEKTSAAERESAQIEIQKIQLQQQIDAKEREKDAAVDAVEAKIDATEAEQDAAEQAARARIDQAQAAVDAQQAVYEAAQAQIALTQEQNALVTEQIALIQRKAEAEAAAASGGSGGGGGPALPNLPTPGAGPSIPNPVEGVESAVRESLSSTRTIIQDELNAAKAEAEAQTQALVESIVAQLDTLPERAGTAFAALAEVSPAFQAIYTVATETFPAIATTVQTAFGIIQQTIQQYDGNIVADVTGTWTLLIDTVGTIASSLAGIITEVFNTVTLFLQEHGDTISANLETAWTLIRDIVQGAAQLVQAIIVPIFDAIAAYIQQNQDTIASIMGGAWDIIAGLVTAALSIINGVIQAALALVQGDFEGAWTAIQDGAQGAMDGLGQVIEGAISLVVGYFTLMLDGAVEEIGKLTGKLKTIGQQAIDGLIEGVRANIGKLLSYAAEIAEDFISQFTSGLQIFSPSQRFADEVGKPSIEGIIEGMLNTVPTMLDEIDLIGEEMLAKLGDIREAAAEIVADIFNAQAAYGFNLSSSLDRANKIFDEARAARELRDLEEERLKIGQKLTDAQVKARQEEEKRKQLSQEYFDLQAQADAELDPVKKAELQRLADVKLEEEKAQGLKATDAANAANAIERQARENAQAIDARKALNEELRRLEEDTLGAISNAQAEAAAMDDPEEATRWLKLRTDQIGKEAELRRQILTAEAEGRERDADSLRERLRIEQQAFQLQQRAEQTRNAADTGTDLSRLVDAINSLDEALRKQYEEDTKDDGNKSNDDDYETPDILTQILQVLSDIRASNDNMARQGERPQTLQLTGAGTSGTTAAIIGRMGR